MRSALRRASALAAALVCASACHVVAAAGIEAVDFRSDRWRLAGGRVTEQAGRVALAGSAWLPDSDLADGVVAVEVFATGATTYPGITFHMESPDDCEYVYLRPHRPAAYGDALQYAPVVKGVGEWQLYNGPGWTAGIEVPKGRWFELRVEVLGARARVFVDGDAEPALEVDHLRRGAAGGAVGLRGPADGSALFADFRCGPAGDLRFGPAAPADAPAGVLSGWQVSAPFTASVEALTAYPGRATLAGLAWTASPADARGYVDVAGHVRWQPGVADAVWARTLVTTDAPRALPLELGYSDAVAVYCNGRLLYAGANGYRSRDPSYLGIVGLFDTVYLPLEAGENELLLGLAESFGGWGFLCRDASVEFAAPGVREVWRAEGLSAPESAVHDGARDRLYVSNFDPARPSGAEGLQSVSLLAPDGRVVAGDWLPGLRNPTGLALQGDRLWVVERTGLVEADAVAGTIIARHALPGARFLNDVATDAAGRLYVSDSAGSAVYRVTGGVPERWLEAPRVRTPNGLLVDGDRLLVGHADGRLTAFDLATGAATEIARLPAGMIDGLAADGRGGWLLSLADGRLFHATTGGVVTKLLDHSGPGRSLADFAYLPARRLAVVPGLRGNDVRAYELP